jgi:hypothetical protein
MPLRKDTLTAEAVKANPSAAIAQISNTITRPGPLTMEWWSVLIAGAASAALAAAGLPGSSAAQVAGIAAPIILALVYAFVRAQTKGALADALKAIFPQATTAPPQDLNQPPDAAAEAG